MIPFLGSFFRMRGWMVACGILIGLTARVFFAPPPAETGWKYRTPPAPPASAQPAAADSPKAGTGDSSG